MNTTPKQKTRTPTKKCNDVEEEFSKRFLSLFTSLYDIPSTEPLVAFPAVPQSRTNTQASSDKKGTRALIKNPPFNAVVWDLRLKKNVETQLEQSKASSDLISAEFDKIAEMIQNEEQQKEQKDDDNELPQQTLDFNELRNIFQPTPAERPDVPKYLQNIQQDYIIDNERHRNPNPPLKISEAEKQFEQRRQKHKQREIEHKKKLLERQAQKEKEHKDFLKTLPKTKTTYDARASNIKYEMKEKHARALELLNKRREGVKVTPSKTRTKSNLERQNNQNADGNYYSKE